MTDATMDYHFRIAIKNRLLLNIYITLANKAPVIFARNHGKFQYFQINISYFGY